MGKKNDTRTRGFIYLWYDRKHKRYYLGKHWGEESDPYDCSSRWMRAAKKCRPDDFHRRTLEWVYDRDLLGDREEAWGLLMKLEELKGIRYYNIVRPGKRQWHDKAETRKTVPKKISKSLQNREPEIRRLWIEKISKSKTGVPNPKQAEAIRGRKLTEEHKKKVSESLQGHGKGIARTEDEKLKISQSLSGRNLPEEHKNKISSGLMGTHRELKSKEHREKLSLANRGKRHSEATKLKMRGRKGSMTGRKHSSEAREKMRLAKIRRS